MGKYMNKSKITGEVTVMDVFSQPTGTNNARTRAGKSLALQKSLLLDANSDVPFSFSYLQLRSRRLQKIDTSKPKKSAPNSNSNSNSSSTVKSTSLLPPQHQGFGFQSQLSSRGTRESTADNRNPCSPTQYSNDTATNGIIQNNLQTTIPTAHEMEEFFASAEHQQQRSFIDKYNYDIVNDKPLDGRYEWVELVL